MGWVCVCVCVCVCQTQEHPWCRTLEALKSTSEMHFIIRQSWSAGPAPSSSHVYKSGHLPLCCVPKYQKWLLSGNSTVPESLTYFWFKPWELKAFHCSHSSADGWLCPCPLWTQKMTTWVTSKHRLETTRVLAGLGMTLSSRTTITNMDWYSEPRSHCWY